MIPAEWFQLAQQRIAASIVRTPLEFDARAELYLKWENQQVTGSFKVRGALNKVLSLEPWERQAGLVAASAGNHGQGVALAAKQTGTSAEIFVPSHAVATKVQAIQDLGGTVHRVDGGYGIAEQTAREYALSEGKTFISPYNDGQVIAGQGTLALEILEQLEQDHHVAARDLAGWIIPVSGGGLACGCAAALAASGERSRIFGIQPAESAFTHGLFHTGTQSGIADNPTLADGLSGPIERDSITIPMMKTYLEDILLATEAQIERGIGTAWAKYGQKIEGSAAVALAAALDGAVRERPCVVVLTGGNIEPAVFDAIVKKPRAEGG